MAAKKLFTQIFIYFSKPLRLLYSLIIYEIVNFSFFTLYSLLLLSFFLYLKSVPIYVIVHVNRNTTIQIIQPVHVHVYTCIHACTHSERDIHLLREESFHSDVAGVFPWSLSPTYPSKYIHE